MTMSFTAYMRSVGAKFLRRGQVSTELDEELRAHIALRADDLARSGLPRPEAERRARVEFGGLESYKENAHRALGGHFLETLIHDLRFALRALGKARGFTFAAIVTLALAIGANAVVFGVLDSLVLTPLDVPQAKTLWGIENSDGTGWQSYPNYLDIRARNRSFEDLAAIKMSFAGIDVGNDDAPATGWATTGNYFDVLRIQPYLGRFFHASDEHGPGSAPFVVLGYSYWHTRFRDDRSVIGRSILINKRPFTIIGVTPPEFHGTLLFIPAAFYMPIVNQEEVDGENILNKRSINNREVFDMLGHLKAGVTPSEAIADLNSIHNWLEKTYPREVEHNTFTLGHPGLYVFAQPVGAFVAGLVLLAALILLAACANLGSLFAAHAADRSREVALRLALGSTRQRILRQLLTQAVLISLVGGAFGLSGSVALLKWLSTWQPFSTAPIRMPITVDAKIYVVAFALAVVSGLLFGIVPVRQVLHADPYGIIKGGPAGTLPSRLGRRISVRDTLLVLQIALCAVLVTSSIVAIRGLMRSLHSNLGFEPDNTMFATVDLVSGGYRGDAAFNLERRTIDALKTVPGVQAVGMVNNYPPLVDTAGNTESVFHEEAHDLSQAHSAASPYRYEVSPGYFEAAATRFLAGKSFSWRDDKSAPLVAVVNREFAVKMFGSVPGAVGRHFRTQDGSLAEVIGVVENGKYISLTEDQQPAMFLPVLQSPVATTCSVFVRSSQDPEGLAQTMRFKLRQLDSGLSIDTETWNNLLDVVLFPARTATMALGVLGLMGAMLSITGIFGMAAYSVSKRIKELGIRVALGARRSEVLRAALGRAVKLLAIGSVAGLVLGILAARVLASIVYQATPRDPLVLAGVVFAMALLGVVATWIPARRALSVDPLILLHEE
jgi:predicted permease